MRDELALLPSRDLLALYRRRAASPMEACEAALGRIARVNPALNAFQHVDEPGARAAARRSEARWTAGEPLGLLDGVPATVKDDLPVAGWPSRSGSQTINPGRDGHEDAPGVARLRENGAILLGTTTMSEFAWKVTTDSPLFGVTRNPHDLSRTPGGSSGGAAAATAAGMGTLALATDGDGSIRVPAARCGLVGFKPTYGVVPDHPPSRFGTRSHVGPIGRTVADVALMVEAIGQPDARDWYGLPPRDQDFRREPSRDLHGMRVAFSPDLGSGRAVHPEIADRVARAVLRLGERGAAVDAVDFDPILHRLGAAACAVLHSAMWADLLRRVPMEHQALMDPALVAAGRQGQGIGLSEYLQAEQDCRLFGVGLNGFFTSWDLLVCPTIHTLPELVGAPPPEPWLTMLFNAARNPAISVPCGTDANGVPVGVQIVGPLYRDACVLRAAAALETLIGVAARPPDLPAESAQPLRCSME